MRVPRVAAPSSYVLTNEDGAATLGARVTRTHPFLDRYRGDREATTRDLYDGRLFREAVFLPMMRDLGAQLSTLEVSGWSIPDPDGRLGATVAKQLGAGTPASANVYAAVGDTGAAAALLGGIAALDTAGRVGIVGFGGGRATGVVINADRPVPGAAELPAILGDGRPASYAEVLRSRNVLVPTGETVPMGVPPESAFAYIAEAAITRCRRRSWATGPLHSS